MEQRSAATGSRNGPANGRRPAVETERAFITAATGLFAERGYNGTSISDLAKQLGLTTASLYYHVSGKQELLLKVLTTGLVPFLEQLERIHAEEQNPRRKLRLAVENHLSFVLHNPQAVAVFLRERRFLESPFKERYQEQVDRYDLLFTEIIDEGMADSASPPNDPHLIRLAILGMINWVVEWYRPGGRLEADEILQTFADLVTERILAPPAS
jgi:TetR/AcrR family transcriptional regulator, cholesterol catabolism regulator